MWVILCRLKDKGRREIEEIVEEINERDGEKGKAMKVKKTEEITRAGVCKTLCPQLPDSNTAWLQHCLPMTVTTVKIYEISTVILSKGNNSKIRDNWDKKKIRVTYFFMRNQNMKFQNISIHGSKLMLYTTRGPRATGCSPEWHSHCRYADVQKNRISRWLPWRPSWIYDRHDFSYFWSTSHPNASYQVSSHLAFRFRRRSEK